MPPGGENCNAFLRHSEAILLKIRKTFLMPLKSTPSTSRWCFGGNGQPHSLAMPQIAVGDSLERFLIELLPMLPDSLTVIKEQKAS